MRAVILIISLSIFVFTSCKSSLLEMTQAELDAFNNIVNNQKFQIESDWLYPQGSAALQRVLNSGILQGGSTSNAISLLGNYNFLKISGDSISSYLPFYGERHMQVGYGGGDSAIEFEGTVKNYRVERNKDHSYNISFDAKSKNEEGFSVYIRLSPYLKSDMTINGNARSSIRFTGIVKPISELTNDN